MYKSLDELMAGIYAMAAPGGDICIEVTKFFVKNKVNLDDIRSGIWFFLWLKAAPKDAVPVQMEIPEFGVVLNMPTYGGMLNECITSLIEDECRKIQLSDDHQNLEAWAESVQSEQQDESESVAAAGIVDLLNGCHDLMDTAIINFLYAMNKISEQDVLSLLYYGELCDHSLLGTPFSELDIPSENNLHVNNIIPIK